MTTIEIVGIVLILAVLLWAWLVVAAEYRA
jgi:hypothetical protein